MADLPISFSGPMVRLMIDDLKGQTRRGLNKLRRFGAIREFGISDTPGYAWHFRDSAGRWHDLRGGEILKYLPYRVGDRLYVREHWKTFASLDNVAPRDLWSPDCGFGAGVLYVADGYGLALTKAGERWEGPREDANAFGKLRQGMHMPKWASRATLIVEGVKIEPLRAISREDAIAEGATERPNCRGDALDRPGWSMDWGQVNEDGPWECDISLPDPESAFLNYFYRINNYAKKYGDDLEKWPNPFVVAYTFRRVMGNIDTIEAPT